MINLQFFLYGFLMIFSWTLTGCGTGPHEKPPNIILIITDDQGYGDFTHMGNPVIQTPNIDSMAARSATMENFYVSPVCSPTRANLMTGRYNYRTGVIDTYIGRSMMRTEEVTIAEILKKAGYATGIFGKWHLGDCYPMRPMDQGFDEALVLKGGGLAQPSEPFENQRHYTNPYLFHNGKMVQEKGYCTDVYFNHAMKFIEKNVRENKPFFAYIPTNAPHGPFHDVPKDLFEKYKAMDIASIALDAKPNADVLAAIAAMIENIDQNVGRLFSFLKKTGTEENTIVVFLTDNGPNTRRYVRQLRGKKGEVLEGGIRTVLYMHWPAKFDGHEKSAIRVAHYDLMPTLLEAAGVPVPDTLHFDGRSFLPLLKDEDVSWPERYLFLQWHRGDEPEPLNSFAMVGQKWELIRQGTGEFELYDIVNDPGEKNNLAGQHPEIVEEMKKGYLEWFHDVSTTRPGNYAKPRIVIGTDHETETILTAQDWTRLSGKGWGNKGSWGLTVAQPAVFDIIVRPGKHIPGWTANLKIGKLSLSKPFDDNDRLTFEGIELEPGDINVVSWISKDTTLFGPHHVIFKRVTPAE